MDDDSFDIVFVPDFSTPRAAAIFEIRSLFFLGSFLENGGRAKQFPLRLACIGEPPRSVAALAERCGANITTSTPVESSGWGFANKLRGLETPCRTSRRLLLDADVLVLGDLAELSGEADFAAAPAGKPHLPESQWRLIYEHLGLPFPSRRIASLMHELGLAIDDVIFPYDEQNAEASSMVPYYNSGVILAPAESPLAEIWSRHLRAIEQFGQNLAHPSAAAAAAHYDQVALATAFHELGERGFSFARLPDAFNCRFIHFRAGTMRLRDVNLLHATGFCRLLESRTQARALVEEFIARWQQNILAGAKKSPDMAPDAARAAELMRSLFEKFVAPVL